MPIDLSGLTVDELTKLAAEAQVKAQQLAAQQRQEDLEESEARKVRIDGAVTRLTNLLGPLDGPLYVPGGTVPATIRSLVGHTSANLAANSGIALKLILQGMDELAVTTRDLAEVMREDN